MIEQHAFVGRTDRWCEVCQLPDRSPVHLPRSGGDSVTLIERRGTELVDGIPENKDAPCNICGRGWPYHWPRCSYAVTAARVAVLEQETEILKEQHESDRQSSESRGLEASSARRVEVDESWVCSWCGDEFEPGDWSSTDCCSCDPVPASSLPSILKEARKEAKDAMDAAFADEELALAAGKTLERAAFIAQHLFEMIDTETWRASGGDDGQGHYEGEYRAAQISEEIRSWTQPQALASATKPEASPSPENQDLGDEQGSSCGGGQ